MADKKKGKSGKSPRYSEAYGANRPNPYTGYLPPGAAPAGQLYHPESINMEKVGRIVSESSTDLARTAARRAIEEAAEKSANESIRSESAAPTGHNQQSREQSAQPSPSQQRREPSPLRKNQRKTKVHKSTALREQQEHLQSIQDAATAAMVTEVLTETITNAASVKSAKKETPKERILTAPDGTQLREMRISDDNGDNQTVWVPVINADKFTRTVPKDYFDPSQFENAEVNDIPFDENYPMKKEISIEGSFVIPTADELLDSAVEAAEAELEAAENEANDEYGSDADSLNIEQNSDTNEVVNDVDSEEDNESNEDEVDSEEDSESDEDEVDSWEDNESDEDEIDSGEDSESDEDEVDSGEDSESDEDEIDSEEDSESDEDEIDSEEIDDDTDDGFPQMESSDRESESDESVESDEPDNDMIVIPDGVPAAPPVHEHSVLPVNSTSSGEHEDSDQDDTLFIRAEKPEGSTTVFDLPEGVKLPAYINDDEFLEQWLSEDEDMAIKNKRRRRRISTIIGTVTMLFALVGFVWVMRYAFGALAGIGNTDATKTKYEEFIAPVAMCDVQPFESWSAIPSDKLLQTSVFHVLINMEESYYETDDTNKIVIPSRDVTAAAQSLFGAEAQLNQDDINILDGDDMYYSDTDDCFHVAATGISGPQAKVINIQKKGSELTLLVGFLGETDAEDSEDYYQTMEYILKTSGEGYIISAIRSPGASD